MNNNLRSDDGSMDTAPDRSAAQRRVALGALAASSQRVPTACPSDSELAAFIDGAVAGSARRNVAAHLGRCPRCYQHWREVAAVVGPLPQASLSRAPISTLLESLEAWTVSWRVALPALAVAASVVVALQWTGQSSAPKPFAAEYAALSAQPGDAVAAAAGSLVLPWEDSALGFSKAAFNEAQHALGAGLWAGRGELVGASTTSSPTDTRAPQWARRQWQATPWSDFYELGRWMMLSWTAASSGAAVDWQAQRDAARRLRGRVASRIAPNATEGGAPRADQETVVEAVAVLDEVESLLSADGAAQRPALARMLLVAMSRLAPASQ